MSVDGGRGADPASFARARGSSVVTGLVEDARLAVRHLVRTPAFVLAVVVVMGVAMGANATVLSLLNAIVIRPLPLPGADRLVVLSATEERGPAARPIYFSTFRQLRALPPFATMAMYAGGGLLWIEARGVTGEGFVEAITPGFHESLGLTPLLGRFISEQDAPGDGPAAAVAVISHRFWQRRYGGEPSAIGDQLLINKVPFTIIGVTPPDYSGLYVENGVDFAVPLGTLGRQLPTNQYPLDPKRPLRAVNVIALLAPEYDLARARAVLDSQWPALRTGSLPPLSGDERVQAERSQVRLESLASGFSRLRGRYGDHLEMFAGVTLTFVVLGAINVAGLIAARATARQREFAVHAALGAPRARQIRRVLIEGLYLALGGAAVGVLIAWWAANALAAFLWDGATPLQLVIAPGSSIVLLCGLMAVGIAIGLAAAIWLAVREHRLAATMTRLPSRSAARSITGLVVIQVSLSLALTCVATVSFQSLTSMQSLEHGIEAPGLRWTRVLPQPGGYTGLNDSTYYPELVRTLEELPGIEQVALAHHFPAFYNFGDQVATYPVGRAESALAPDVVSGMVEYISPGFFDAVGVPIVRGRDFRWSDDQKGRGVVVINDSMSRALFGDGDPVGRQIRIDSDPSRQRLEVVGVARDATMGAFRMPHQPVVFRPKAQEPRFNRVPVVVFRSSLPSGQADALLSAAVSGLGREYVRRVYSFDEQLGIAAFEERLTAGVSGGFAALAVSLAGLGLLAQLTYVVALRRNEIAVRVAVGAAPGKIAWMIVRQSLATVIAGVALGIPIAVAAVRAVPASAAGDGSHDVTVFWVTAGVFTAVTVMASLRPARRAAAISPIVALRSE